MLFVSPTSDAPETPKMTATATATTTTITWSNKPGSRSRSAWLLLVDAAGVVHRFEGQTIRGLCVVRGEKYQRNGKWSGSDYEIVLARGVRSISGRAGWETGTFLEGLAAATYKPTATWEEVAVALGTTREQAETFVRAWKPGAAEILDQREADLASLA